MAFEGLFKQNVDQRSKPSNPSSAMIISDFWISVRNRAASSKDAKIAAPQPTVDQLHLLTIPLQEIFDLEQNCTFVSFNVLHKHYCTTAFFNH